MYYLAWDRRRSTSAARVFSQRSCHLASMALWSYGLLMSSRLSLSGQAAREGVLLQQAVQQAVHEAARLLGAELLGQLDGFVEHHELGGVPLVEHLEDGQAQDVAVHRRHALQPPVVGLAADQVVDPLAVVHRAADEHLGVLESLAHPLLALGEVLPLVEGGRRRLLLLGSGLAGQIFREVERVEDMGQRAAAQVTLVEHLDRHLPRHSPLSCRHGTSPQRPQWKYVMDARAAPGPGTAARVRK